jgi:LmbE family N-acetylglucosaminyl deacetylase
MISLGLDRELLNLVTAPLDDPRPQPPSLVVIAHPDDEVLALGGRLPRFHDCYFLQVTDGAPLDGIDCANHGFASLDDYREARRKEVDTAYARAGISLDRKIELNVPDQRAAFHLELLIESIRFLLKENSIRAVITHPYEGGHPDHDACAFAVYSAVQSLPYGVPKPLIIEATFYHAGPKGIETNCFLSEPPAAASLVRTLREEEQQLKRELLACFSSQQEVLQYFSLVMEQYRIAPIYDFSRPPHPGTLFYERYFRGIDGKRFCQLTAAASSLREQLCG